MTHHAFDFHPEDHDGWPEDDDADRCPVCLSYGYCYEPDRCPKQANRHLT